MINTTKIRTCWKLYYSTDSSNIQVWFGWSAMSTQFTCTVAQGSKFFHRMQISTVFLFKCVFVPCICWNKWPIIKTTTKWKGKRTRQLLISEAKVFWSFFLHQIILWQSIFILELTINSCSALEGLKERNSGGNTILYGTTYRHANGGKISFNTKQ